MLPDEYTNRVMIQGHGMGTVVRIQQVSTEFARGPVRSPS
jgi:hypothetical protein